MPPSSPPIVITEDDDDEGDKTTAPTDQSAVAADCSICYEPYSGDGSHRPATLKCGHVAGESCLRKWLESKKVCPTCRKTARAKDLVLLFNLPVVSASGSDGGAPAAAAAAAAANSGEQAQREMMLQKMQRAYIEKDKEVQRQREEMQRQKQETARVAKEAKRRTEEAERELKRVRRELQETRKQLAAQVPGAAPPAAGGRQDLASLYPTAGGGPPQQPQGANAPGPGSAGSAAMAPNGGMMPPLPLPGYPFFLAGTSSDPARGGGGAAPPPGTPLPYVQLTQACPRTQWPGGPAPPGGGSTASHTHQPPVVRHPASGSLWGHFGGAQGADPTAAAPNCGAGGDTHHHLFPQRHQYHRQGGVWDMASGGPPQWQQQQPNHHHHHHPNHLPHASSGWPGSAGRESFQPVVPVKVDGCRLLALDPASSRLLVSETQNKPGGVSCIRKISIHAPESYTRIRLPPNAGIVYDMQLRAAAAGAGGNGGGGGDPGFLAVTTQGAGLSLVCTRSDNVVTTFTGLPYKAWCGSWVPHAAAGAAAAVNFPGSSAEHLLVAGLANGHLALLDTRRPDGPVAVLPVLQQAARTACAQMPVRTVAALPYGLPTSGPEGGTTGAAGGGGVVWPSCVFSCPKGAWLMLGGGESSGGGGGATEGSGTDGLAAAAAAAAPSFVCLDGGHGGGSTQVESLSLHYSDWEGRDSGGGGGGGAVSQPWRVVLSWRPGDTPQAVGAGAGPRHEVGLLRPGMEAPYTHEATVTGYTRRGIQSVRNCLLPPPPPSPYGWDGSGGFGGCGPGGELLLATSDDDSRQPLIWSLPRRAAEEGASGAAGGGGFAAPHVIQRLEPHPEAPVCMAAAGISGGCLLACASQSHVVLYRRRGG